MSAAPADPLELLRRAVASSSLPIPTSTADATTNTDAVSLDAASHLLFNHSDPHHGNQHLAIHVNTPTRFISAATSTALDLLSIYLCWLNKDSNAAEYFAATLALNEQRSKGQLSNASNLVFGEKLDLVTYLSGESTESEYIKSIDNNADTKQQAQDAAEIVRDGTTGVISTQSHIDADSIARDRDRTREIINAERCLGDRNTVLRGIKPTDFSHIRKYTDIYLRKSSARPTGPTPVASSALRPNRPTSTTGRRPEPIILLSPSASSLLRLANIRSFLMDGMYTPPSNATGATMLNITRTLPSIDPAKPQRFVLVEGPENFKPDYWNRVVAVFTTGQAWQFKGYKWQNSAELFSHALGVYVGWRGEQVPDTVKGWGRGVISVGVDQVREGGATLQSQQQLAQARWRDREVVEEIWSGIEASMRMRGWAKSAR